MKNIKFIFKWYDLWIGVFIDKEKELVYILPIPCIGIVWDARRFINWIWDNVFKVSKCNIDTKGRYWLVFEIFGVVFIRNIKMWKK